MKEVFKDIPNYEGLYQISNLGNVKSTKRYVKGRKNSKRIIKERILKPGISSNGYLTVSLCKDSKGKTYQIHQLVAMVFLNHKPDRYKLVVDHINNDPLDNRIENLQITTNRYNCSKDKKNVSSKYIGVSFCKTYKIWVAQIRIKGKSKHLGRYKTEIEARMAYQKALNKFCYTEKNI